MDRIGILGVGNTLLGDDGFGPCCVEHLERQYAIPDNVQILDGGTSALFLSPFIDDLDALYIFDAVQLDDEPGSIHWFSAQSLCGGNLQSRLSPHQVGLMEILELCRLRGTGPDFVEMITVVPDDVSVRIGLSACLQGKVQEAIDLLLGRMGMFGVILHSKYPCDSIYCKEQAL